MHFYCWITFASQVLNMNSKHGRSAQNGPTMKRPRRPVQNDATGTKRLEHHHFWRKQPRETAMHGTVRGRGSGGGDWMEYNSRMVDGSSSHGVPRSRCLQAIRKERGRLVPSTNLAFMAPLTPTTLPASPPQPRSKHSR
jgi:hypothetical protein